MSLKTSGYGQYRFKGRARSVNRIISHLVHGTPLEGKFDVKHSCNNPPCFNPNHLTPDTHKNNMKDASRDELITSGGGGVLLSKIPEWARGITKWNTSRIVIKK